MNTTQVRVVGTGLLLLVIILSGIWLSRLGKPYNTPVFTIHKLIGIAAGVFLGVIVYRTNQVAPLGAVEIMAIVVTVLLFVGTVVAGGLLSIGKAMPPVVLRLHQIVPVLAVLSTAWTLYLLLGSK